MGVGMPGLGGAAGISASLSNPSGIGGSSGSVGIGASPSSPSGTGGSVSLGDPGGGAPRRFFAALWKYKFLYALAVPSLAFTLVFAYLPLSGLIVAFKDYDIWKGMMGSPWAASFGLEHFAEIFRLKPVIASVGNTLLLSTLNLLIGFPMPIAFALLLNELRHMAFKKTVQTISYMPNFLSWISVIGLTIVFFGEYGPLNGLLSTIDPDRARVLYLSKNELFLPFLLFLNLWKNMGFQSIIFLAAITAVDVQLFEAAEIDGAGRLKQVWHITLPSIAPTVSVMLILSIGGILSSNFELVFGLQNAFIDFETIDTVVYKYGLLQRGYSLATAVGLARGLIALLLTVAANYATKRMGNTSMF
jgi:putative aldouronate transport system permease protein